MIFHLVAALWCQVWYVDAVNSRIVFVMQSLAWIRVTHQKTASLRWNRLHRMFGWFVSAFMPSNSIFFSCWVICISFSISLCVSLSHVFTYKHNRFDDLLSFGLWWDHKNALVKRFTLAVKRVMCSPGDPKLSGVICAGRECLTGKDISQTPPWHHQLSMAETLVPNKDWSVSDYHCVSLREPEKVFMDVKSANVVMILQYVKDSWVAREWLKSLRMFYFNIPSANNSDNEITVICNQFVFKWTLEGQLCYFGGNTTAN